MCAATVICAQEAPAPSPQTPLQPGTPQDPPDKRIFGVLPNYRTANEISHRNVAGQASTEDLRQAVVAYRSLFEELLAESANA